MANFGAFLRLALLCSVILRYSYKIFQLILQFWKCLLLGLNMNYSYEHHAYHHIFSEEIIRFVLVCSMISAPNKNLTCHHWNICVTASYFRQADARPRHLLIETEDEAAVDEPASLNRKGSCPMCLNVQWELSQEECTKMCKELGKDNCLNLCGVFEAGIATMVWSQVEISKRYIGSIVAH